jgi:hypothetical protein
LLTLAAEVDRLSGAAGEHQTWVSHDPVGRTWLAVAARATPIRDTDGMDARVADRLRR